MTETEHRIEKVHALFAEFIQEAHALMRDMNAVTGYTASGSKVIVIQQTVAEYFEVPVTAMTSQIRTLEFAQPRMIAMLMCRELTKFPLMVIGRAFGGRDHGTVMHACKTIAGRVCTEKEFARKVDEVRKRCEAKIAAIEMPLFSASA